MSRAIPQRRLAAAAVGLACVLASAAAFGDEREAGGSPAERTRYSRIHVVDFDGEIEPALAAYVVRSLDAAKDGKADCVVLRIKSPGGRVDSSEKIGDAVLGLGKSIRTIAWVEEYAYSGATMAALACDEIVMRPGARMGDAQPIFLTGEGIQPVGEKMETVLRAVFRRYAEDNGWNAVLVEKFVSKDGEVVLVREKAPPHTEHYVDGREYRSARAADLVAGVRKDALERVRVVVADGKLLTLTTTEATSLGFVRRTFDDEKALLAAISADGASVSQVRMSWRETASRWLLGVTGILGALVVLCAGISVFNGLGLSTIVGVCALLLVGLVTVTADLEAGFPMFLVGLGLLLLFAEAFLIPGFGIAGILGIASAAAGFLFLATGFRPGASGGGSLTWESAAVFLAQFAGTLLVGSIVVVLLSRLVPTLPFARRHLHLPLGGLGAGAAVVPGLPPPLPGVEGVASTDLRPSGRATIDGRVVDVVSEGGFVESGTPLRVLRVEGERVVVRARVPLESTT